MAQPVYRKRLERAKVSVLGALPVNDPRFKWGFIMRLVDVVELNGRTHRRVTYLGLRSYKRQDQPIRQVVFPVSRFDWMALNTDDYPSSYPTDFIQRIKDYADSRRQRARCRDEHAPTLRLAGI